MNKIKNKKPTATWLAFRTRGETPRPHIIIIRDVAPPFSLFWRKVGLLVTACCLQETAIKIHVIVCLVTAVDFAHEWLGAVVIAIPLTHIHRHNIQRNNAFRLAKFLASKCIFLGLLICHTIDIEYSISMVIQPTIQLVRATRTLSSSLRGFQTYIDVRYHVFINYL